MSGRISIRLEVDPSCREPEITIRVAEPSELTERIISAIEHSAEGGYPRVTAARGDTVVQLDQREIIRIYTENRRLMICTSGGLWETRQTLRNLEGILDPSSFVRISRFEIINLNRVAGFDFSHAGTVRVFFADGSQTWAARRYVQAIQQALKNPGREA